MSPAQYSLAEQNRGLKHHFLYAGGENPGRSFASVDRYNPATNTWSRVADMNRPRSAAGVAVLKGKIYVAGKQGQHRLFNDTLLINITPN